MASSLHRVQPVGCTSAGCRDVFPAGDKTPVMYSPTAWTDEVEADAVIPVEAEGCVRATVRTGAPSFAPVHVPGASLTGTTSQTLRQI